MKMKFYLNGKKTTRKALFAVCGPLVARSPGGRVFTPSATAGPRCGQRQGAVWPFPVPFSRCVCKRGGG